MEYSISDPVQSHIRNSDWIGPVKMAGCENAMVHLPIR